MVIRAAARVDGSGERKLVKLTAPNPNGLSKGKTWLIISTMFIGLVKNSAEVNPFIKQLLPELLSITSITYFK
jgi:hypothetical protein